MNMTIRRAVFLLCLFLLPASSFALLKGSHVKASLVSEVESIQPGTPFWVAIRLEMQPKWHTYWKNPGESGAPTEVSWQLPEGFKAGPLIWPTPIKIELPPVVSYGYEDEVLLLTQIFPPAVFRDTRPLTLKAQVDWLECEVVCIPGQAEVSLTLPLLITSPKPHIEWQERFSRTRFQWPLESSEWSVLASSTRDGFRLTVNSPKNPPDKPADLLFFAEDPNVIAYAAPQKFTPTPQGGTLDLFKSEASTSPVTYLRGVLVTSLGWRGPASEKALSINAPVSKSEGVSPTSLWPGSLQETRPGRRIAWALLLAFIGGFILNLMPCVLPVISLKILNFIQQTSGHSKKIAQHGWVFAAGVIVSFWALAGLLIALRASGQQIGWGFQMQNPFFVGFLFVLFLLLALNLFGLFEIGTKLIQLAGVTKGKSGFAGSFLNGVLATIVATPCTAPFMGVALGFALAQPPLVSFLVFTSLGLGMSFPYILLSSRPAFLKWVPKPGPWMIKFKSLMGVFLLATAFWLGWILYLQLVPKQENTLQTNQRGGIWEPFSEERVKELRNQGRIVFVDFTAAWCLTCQVNERVVLNSEVVSQAFKGKNIAMLKADWTSHDEKITLALQKFGRSGVPFYVLYPSAADSPPITLPEILTNTIVLDAISKIQ
ncbi:MAG: Thiol:disulfide interchange protein DsbD [Elusimicrobia bacterium]|nr:Thiol:disulfide interchange protein DsbD [Elusimicrobiota bacterium]